MSSHSKYLKQTTGLLEANMEIKSYIHQQILDFEPFITAETTILVIARDPHLNESEFDNGQVDEAQVKKPKAAHRIVIILKEDDSTIEAEAFDDDIFQAIKKAKENLVVQLLAIQNEIENSQERLEAIQLASGLNRVH